MRRQTAGPVHVAHYAPHLPQWPADLPLRIVALSDFHLCTPWMNAGRLAAICAQANALKPDIILLLGDYLDGPRFSRPAASDWAEPLAALSAPLGVHAILGNHDYKLGSGGAAEAAAVTAALHAVNLPVYINQAARLETQGRGFWLAGLGDQYALLPKRENVRLGFGLDDLPATLAQVTTDEPILLMAHEPDIFPDVPERVALTLSGHTHAGQVTLFGYAPVVPSRFGQRFLHGHVVEGDRHLIVSGGLGYSGLPIRMGASAEMLLIDLGQQAKE
jgi:predicted MPP superfamily phosphohydrolase